MLLISEYIAQHELKPLQKHLKLEDVVKGAQKILKGLGKMVGGPGMPKGISFYKIRIGKANKARMIVFAVSENQQIVPILIRLKKDKKIGANMSSANPYAVLQVKRNFARALKDIEDGNFKSIEV